MTPLEEWIDEMFERGNSFIPGNPPTAWELYNILSVIKDEIDALKSRLA